MDFIIDNLPRFLGGAWLTIQLVLFSSTFGLIMALPIALARLSRNPALNAPATAYVFFFRGTPLLAQIFLIYYGSGQFRHELNAIGLWAFFRDPWFCALLSLTLNTAAYTSEILRGAIQAVLLPRAIGIGWPAYTNEVVYQIQATSLVSIITIMDITGVARAVGARDFTFFEAFGLAALLYLILVYGFIFAAKRIEKRLNAHLVRPDVARQRKLAGSAI
ncbi:MAG: ABC transporter permease subunit [Maritimibacter sp.]